MMKMAKSYSPILTLQTLRTRSTFMCALVKCTVTATLNRTSIMIVEQTWLLYYLNGFTSRTCKRWLFTLIQKSRKIARFQGQRWPNCYDSVELKLVKMRDEKVFFQKRVKMAITHSHSFRSTFIR